MRLRIIYVVILQKFPICTTILQEVVRQISLFPELKGQSAIVFFYNAISEWNLLSNNVKYSENFSQFEKAVKRHLSSQADF